MDRTIDEKTAMTARTDKMNPRTNMAPTAAITMVAVKQDTIGAGICPSDWDKYKTLFVNPYIQGTYERRFKVQRRGQDSLEPCLLQSSRSRQLLIYQEVIATT